MNNQLVFAEVQRFSDTPLTDREKLLLIACSEYVERIWMKRLTDASTEITEQPPKPKPLTEKEYFKLACIVFHELKTRRLCDGHDDGKGHSFYFFEQDFVQDIYDEYDGRYDRHDIYLAYLSACAITKTKPETQTGGNR